MADEIAAPSTEQARTALGDAARAQASVAAGEARWPARYLAGFGIAIAALFPVLGLVPGPVGVSVFMAVWLLVMTVLVRYAQRQAVTRRGQGRRMGISFGGWALVYGAGVLVGESQFAGVPAYWIPMAVVVAVPFLAGAWWVGRA